MNEFCSVCGQMTITPFYIRPPAAPNPMCAHCASGWEPPANALPDSRDDLLLETLRRSRVKLAQLAAGASWFAGVHQGAAMLSGDLRMKEVSAGVDRRVDEYRAELANTAQMIQQAIELIEQGAE